MHVRYCSNIALTVPVYFTVVFHSRSKAMVFSKALLRELGYNSEMIRTVKTRAVKTPSVRVVKYA